MTSQRHFQPGNYKSFTIILTALLFIFIFSTAIADTYTVEFSSDNLNFEKIGDYDIIRLENASAINEPGFPMLPEKIIKVALPEGLKAEKINIVDITYKSLDQTYQIFPAQKPIPISTDRQNIEFIEPKREIYYSNSPWPPNPAEILHHADLAGQSFAKIAVYPIEYTPLSGQVRIVESITFEITGSSDYICGDYLPAKATPKMIANYKNRLNDLVINESEITPRTSPYMQKEISNLPDGLFEHVIITTSTFAPHYQPLIEWHTRKGMPDTAVTIDWIYANYAGSDNQEKIRNFVIDAHQNWGSMFFLMGGEHLTIPMEYRIYDSDIIPSDAYYADYDDDWEYEVFIGRITADNATEVNRFVNKTLAYEINPPSQYFSNDVILVGMDLTTADDPPYYTATRGSDLKDAIDQYLPTYFNVNKIYDLDQSNHLEDFNTAFNSGVNLINHCDHSNSTLMGMGDRNHGWYIFNGDIPYFTNYGQYSVIHSLGCHANHMDYEDAISENFILANDTNGAVSFTGNTRSGWFYVGDPLSLSSELDLNWWIGLFAAQKYTAGEALAFTKSITDTDQDWPYSEWTLNLLGDPAMPIWTKTPQQLYIVSHPSEILAVPQEFAVNISLSEGIDSALVCLWLEEDIYETAYTNEDGDAFFNISPAERDTMLITITKQNLRPYLGHAVVIGNLPPECIVPADTQIVLCDPQEIALPVGCSDPDNNILSGPSLVRGPGEITDGYWRYTPTGDDSIEVTISCTDSLFYTCQSNFIVKIDMNDPPNITAPEDTSYVVIGSPAEIKCPVSFDDINGNSDYCSVVSGPGTIDGNLWRYLPDDDGEWDITLEIADLCGETAQDQFHISYVAYICGDADDNGQFNLLDITFLVSYLYKQGDSPEPIESGDANADGLINLLDITYLISYLYSNGPAPACP